MKHKLLIILFSFLTNFAFGQIEELLELRNLYCKTDSIKNLKKPFIISEEFQQALTELDNEPPAKYFEKFNDYLKKDKFDECSFLYHIGVVRYNYCNWLA